MLQFIDIISSASTGVDLEWFYEAHSLLFLQRQDASLEYFFLSTLGVEVKVVDT